MISDSPSIKTNNTIEMNEIQTLSAVDLDAVTSAMKSAFDFTVAGMHVTGGYDTSNGNYGVMVAYDNRAIVQGGTV